MSQNEFNFFDEFDESHSKESIITKKKNLHKSDQKMTLINSNLNFVNLNAQIAELRHQITDLGQKINKLEKEKNESFLHYPVLDDVFSSKDSWIRASYDFLNLRKYKIDEAYPILLKFYDLWQEGGYPQPGGKNMENEMKISKIPIQTVINWRDKLKKSRFIHFSDKIK
ncbi:MAG: hypothetical protein ACXAC7_01750 [Candidatus Hodarchaeales archaeon]|jgi:hypothetical protein